MNKSTPDSGRKALLSAVRATVKAADGQRVSLSTFLGRSGFKRCQIFKYYERWPQVLHAAGFHFKPYKPRIEASRVLADWGAVVRKLGRTPTMKEYNEHGKYSASLFKLRIGSWGSVPSAFRAFAGRRAEWKDILPLLPEDPAPVAEPRKSVAPPPRVTAKFPALPNGRPLRGSPLGFAGMLNAPVNEMGVIFLFAILAPGLGLHVESLQAGFPDCEARRLVGAAIWQTVRIEFEFASRSFRDHGHPPEGCDIIVCWTHNWPDCPKNLEVIELSKEVKRFLERA